MDKVKEFWDIQAEVHKSDSRATSPDHFYRDMEIDRIMEHLESGPVLDVGCGNGYSTIRFARTNPRTTFIGMDYSTPMIAEAKKIGSLYPNADFIVGDVRKPLTDLIKKSGPFQTVVSERCLINLADWGEQQQALLNMKYALSPSGKIILVENTSDGLKRLNALRGACNLPNIEVRWHNHYLPQQSLLDFCSKYFNIEYIANIGGMYYVISRVVYAAMCAEAGTAPDYDAKINEIAAKLPYIPCNFSPNMMIILRNRP